MTFTVFEFDYKELLCYPAGMKINHSEENDYPKMLEAFDKLFAEEELHGLAMIIQICNLMTLECLEATVQEANDRWTFETGRKEHEQLLSFLESQLKEKREKGG